MSHFTIYSRTLVLDICYINFVEVLYELGKNKNSAISYVLTWYSDKDKIGLYSKLAFAKDNDWAYLLSYKTYRPQQIQGNELELELIILKQDALYACFSTMSQYKIVEEKRNILRNMMQYKGWS